MYTFGQKLTIDLHFQDHIEHQVPVQIYLNSGHKDIGFVEGFSDHFIEMNQTFYNRNMYIFVSRPGY
jgi:sRNA-binding regulator protein Hfq